ncbi:hypothetical protein D9M68_999740 [compost metagenome]
MWWNIDHATIEIDYLNTFEIMTLPHFKIVWIVCWSDLDGASTKIHINIVVGDNGNLAIGKRQLNTRTNQVLVSFVVRVDSDCDIS